MWRIFSGSKLFFVSCILMLASAQSRAQNFSAIEDTLAQLSGSFLNRNADEEFKAESIRRFETLLEETLSDPGSMEYPFSKLNFISQQKPEDNSFRLLTWFTLGKNGYTPHGIIQVRDSRKKNSVKVYILHNNEEMVKSILYKTLDADEWFGALYYDMIEFKYRKKKAWILLGFNANDGIIHKKVVDVLTFGSKSEPKFGAGVFSNEDRIASRYILQYSARAKVSLSYSVKNKMIIFDHLSPERPGMENQFQNYGPDFSYDAFKLEGEKWVYKKDVDARNKDENKGSDGKHYDLKLPGSETEKQ